MTYLITGHKGFIGTNLTNYLQSKKETVIGLDYSSCDLCSLIPQFIWAKHLDIIVHLAAETDVRKSIKSPTNTFLRNCKSTINVLELATAKNVKLIFISSCGAAYSTSPYTASKAAGESLCKAYRDSYKTNVVILRLPNIYGPHSNHKSSVIPKFIKSKLLGHESVIYGDGTQTRDFLYVEDVCNAIYNAEQDLELTTGQLTSINDLAKLIGCIPEHVEKNAGEITNQTSTKNITPEFTLEQGLEKTITWFKWFYKIDN